MESNERYRAALEAELAASLAALTAHRADVESVSDLRRNSNVDDEHDPEGATIAFELSQASTMMRDAQRRSGEIEAALERLDRGVYGTCEVCGEAIAEGRLEARPWTPFCRTHASGLR